MASTGELACIYSSLILADDNVSITADKIKLLLDAANVQVEPFWSILFAKALTNIDVKDLITNLSSGVGSGPAAVGVAPSEAAVESSEKAEDVKGKKGGKKEEAKKESEEEDSDADMGFGLFD